MSRKPPAPGANPAPVKVEFTPRHFRTVSALMHAWLAEQGMTQEQLARRLGVSTRHMSNLANGRAGITPKMQISLQRVTGIPAKTWAVIWALEELDNEIRKQNNRITAGTATDESAEESPGETN